jgi:RNA polymerase sigma factor (sigma-70 family)
MRTQEELLATRSSLLTRLKDWQDNQSWKVFFETYWRLIYSAGLRSGLTDAEAQDVVQETVLAVARKIGEFRYDPALGSFKGWLLQLTRWRIADQLAKRRRENKSAEGSRHDTPRTATIERVPDPNSPNLDAIWEQQWQQNLMEAALERVRQTAAAKQYQLFDLYVIKGWRVEDIIGALRVTEHQVYKAKTRILALVRKEVKRLEKTYY